MTQVSEHEQRRRLHREIADRDMTIWWLRGQVAEHDRRIAWLHTAIAALDRRILAAHEALAARSPHGETEEG